MAVVFEKTKGLTDAKLHYCPGCAHGIVHRLVAEVLEEMGELGNSIVAVPVGCAVFANNYFNIDAIQCAHGRTYPRPLLIVMSICIVALESK